MPRLASPAPFMPAMLLAGCASAPEVPDDAMSADQLCALAFGAQQPKSLDELQGRHISVRGKVDLRYGGQQRLLALVYPACAVSTMVFLEVAKLTKD